MANAKPKSSGGGIVDLSNDKAWQARLDEARAKRAQILKDTGQDEARKAARSMPWDEADTADGDVDFYDRINRFKKLAGIEKAPERSQEELDRIDRLLTGRQRTLRMERSRPLDTKPEETPTPSRGVTTSSATKKADGAKEAVRKPVLALTPDEMLSTAAEQAVEAVEPRKSLKDSANQSFVVSDQPEEPRKKRWFAGWYPFTSICIAAGALLVALQGAAITVYFWDSTPPLVQGSVSSLPSVVLDDLGFGAMAPDSALETWGGVDNRSPSLSVPAADTSIENQSPAPRPFASL